jgi:predicted transcriptional regulator
MVREFVDRVFNGSAEPLMAQLVEDRHLSREEVEKIALAIEEGQ